MLSKIKLFESFSRFGYRKITHFVSKDDMRIANGLRHFSFNGYCTMVESTDIEMIESPELPNWVKFLENDNPSVRDSDDDFVIPAVADWVENQKLQDRFKGVETKPSEIVIDSDLEIVSKVLKIRYSSPDEAADALNDCNGMDISEGVIQRLMKRFSHDWIPAFGVFKWAMLQKGYTHSPDPYNLMIEILGKAKKFDLMWELAEEMRHIDGYVTLDTMTKILRRLVRAGKPSDAIKTFSRMEEFGVKKDVYALNILIDALVKENAVEEAQKVFLEFKDEIPPDFKTFNILIHGWCKARKLDYARNTSEEMEKHGFQATVVTYTSFIEAYCRERDYRKVNEILDEMEKKGCPSNIVTYTIIMHSLGKSKEIGEALKIYERMKKDGCVPDASFYSSLIYILGISGRLKDAQEIFEDMPKQGVPPTVLTYNTMIYFACQHSQEETALNLIKKMEEANCKPDLRTYAPLLKMFGRKKRMKVLSLLLNHMFTNDVSIEVGTYALLVDVLCKNGKLEHACMFFEEMVLKGLSPRDGTFRFLIERLESHGMGKAKRQIEKLMLQVKK